MIVDGKGMHAKEKKPEREEGMEDSDEMGEGMRYYSI